MERFDIGLHPEPALRGFLNDKEMKVEFAGCLYKNYWFNNIGNSSPVFRIKRDVVDAFFR